MTQGTIVIANGAGAVVRSAINTSNEALATKQSGASAPSPTYPYMDWADTANDLLKQRNAANSAWIIKGVLSSEYGGIPASAIPYDPGSPALLSADNVQDALDELAADSGTAGLWELINTYTPSAVASQAITGFDNSLYSDYRIVLDHLAPSSDATTLLLRTSTDGGSTYDSGAGNYGHAFVGFLATDAVFSGGSAGDTSIQLTPTNYQGNAAGETISGEIRIINPGEAAPSQIFSDLFGLSSASNPYIVKGGGRRFSEANVDAVQLRFGAGNIASGAVRFYGLRK